MADIPVINPATGETISVFRPDDSSSIHDKYQQARAAQPAWAKRSLDDRLAILQHFRTLVINKTDALAHLLTTEVGKPLTQSRNELNGFLGRLDFFLSHLKSTLGEETVFNEPPMREKIVHEPLGVIANISAWNYPWLVGCNVFIPALLTGNTVLYKPSEFASLTGLAIRDLLWEAGVPQDVFIPVLGKGDVGQVLLQQQVNGIFFTGSYATGQRVAEIAAHHLTRVQLELGGKDPIYVCDDVDVASAAAAVADGAFYNNGQSCCAVERVYVHQAIYDEFVAAFTQTVKGFVTGDPLNEKTYIGALTRRELQIQALAQQVTDALQQGAKLQCGGKAIEGPGWYFEPTVLSEVNHHMAVMTEETFGPLIGIQRVQDDAEALTLMNDTPYGLTAGIYTPNQERATTLLAQVNAGSVYWNCCDRVSPRLPWSGRGHSGLGATLSTYGILAFTQPKAWHLKG